MPPDSQGVHLSARGKPCYLALCLHSPFPLPLLGIPWGDSPTPYGTRVTIHQSWVPYPPRKPLGRAARAVCSGMAARGKQGQSQASAGIATLGGSRWRRRALSHLPEGARKWTAEPGDARGGGEACEHCSRPWSRLHLEVQVEISITWNRKCFWSEPLRVEFCRCPQRTPT